MLSTLTFLKDFIDTDELSDDSGPDPFLYGVAILKLYTDRPKKSISASGEITNDETAHTTEQESIVDPVDNVTATHADSDHHNSLSSPLSEVGDTDNPNNTTSSAN